MSDLIKTQQEIAAPKKILPQSNVQNNKVKVPYFTTRRITYIATLTAMTVVLKILGNLMSTPAIRLSFVYLGWMIASIVLGPFGGVVVSMASDILGWFVVPSGGAFNPVITLGNMIFPLIIGLSYRLPLKNKNLALGIGTLAAVIVCTMGINTLGLYFIGGANKISTYFEYLISRTMQPVIVGLNLVIFLSILPVIKRLKLFGNIK